VDDDPDIVEVIRGVLEDQGLTVDTASDGREALALAQRQMPDLVVLDVTLPVLSSSHVAGYMRALNSGAVPLLVITADGHAREKATQLGAYTYLRKPFELTDLLDAVWRGLRP
jgi:DNA-binding response OmpR family regulator